MQTLRCEMPWFRTLRAVALMLAVVLGLDWTAPIGGFAQPKTEPASTPPTSVENQDPPIQKAEVIEEPTPFYKKWWFWVIVVVVAAVGAAAAVIASDPPSPGLPGPQ